jgi:D-cysteine desulfhydrase
MSPERASLTSHLPRVRLAHLPTPIELLPRLSKYLGGPELFVKRDDQTGLATGGNKARKLEFLLAEALKQGADSVITAGAAQSNHARQTVAAAARCGLEGHLVLRAPGAQPPPETGGNLLLDQILGAVIHWTEEPAPYSQTIAQVEQELKAQGRRPYVVPFGGSNAVGLMGYVAAMEEAAQQMEAIGEFDAHVIASGSGGTQAGMILGAHLTGLLPRTRLLGVSASMREGPFSQQIANLVNDGARLLGNDWRINDDVPDITDDYTGAGYGVVGDPEREAITLMGRHEGILVDPVYTGRALAGLIDLIRQGEFRAGQRVLFWHTGGSAALFVYANEIVGTNP